jgi:glycosidase
MMQRTLPALAALLLACAAGGAWAQPTLDTRPVPATARASALPSAWHHGAFMEIFVRAWRDSDGDGVGDLKGLIQGLDYLQDLGVKGLWLMPIMKNADGDHGYATSDYRDIAPEYGSLADFDELVRQAHRRGIGVIVDYVINHSAATHPFFQQSIQGPDNPFRAWYVWSEDAPPGWLAWGQYPWHHAASQPWTQAVVSRAPLDAGARDFYFGVFCPQMPDFNFKHPAVLDYHLDSLRFWLNRGLDGFRLDAAAHLVENGAQDWLDQPQSRLLIKRVQDEIKTYENRYVVCEATHGQRQYADPAVCGGAFAFEFSSLPVGAALGQPEAVQQLAAYFRQASPTMATFVSNHDRFAGARLWDQVQGDERAYKLAAAGYLLQPGTPFIYYGEEVGQAGLNSPAGDPALRGPMSWSADPGTAGFTTGLPFRPPAPNAATHNVAQQQREPGSIFNFYKALLKLRNTLPSVARGSFEGSFAQGLVLGWQRKWADGHRREHTLVLINYNKRPAAADMAGLPAGARLVSAYPAGGALATRVSGQGHATLLLAPQSLRVLVVETGAQKKAPAHKLAKRPSQRKPP